MCFELPTHANHANRLIDTLESRLEMERKKLKAFEKRRTETEKLLQKAVVEVELVADNVVAAEKDGSRASEIAENDNDYEPINPENKPGFGYDFSADNLNKPVGGGEKKESGAEAEELSEAEDVDGDKAPLSAKKKKKRGRPKKTLIRVSPLKMNAMQLEDL